MTKLRNGNRHGHRFRERSPRKADVPVSSKWVSSGDWTVKEPSVLGGGGAFASRGLDERIFSSTAVRRQIQAGEKSRSPQRDVPRKQCRKKKSGGARDSAAWKKPEAA
jgi:hypothetical protein